MPAPAGGPRRMTARRMGFCEPFLFQMLGDRGRVATVGDQAAFHVLADVACAKMNPTVKVKKSEWIFRIKLVLPDRFLALLDFLGELRAIENRIVRVAEQKWIRHAAGVASGVIPAWLGHAKVRARPVTR